MIVEMKLLKEDFGAYSSGESYEEKRKRKGNKRTRRLEDQFRHLNKKVPEEENRQQRENNPQNSAEWRVWRF